MIYYFVISYCFRFGLMQLFVFKMNDIRYFDYFFITYYCLCISIHLIFAIIFACKNKDLKILIESFLLLCVIVKLDIIEVCSFFASAISRDRASTTCCLTYIPNSLAHIHEVILPSILRSSAKRFS